MPGMGAASKFGSKFVSVFADGLENITRGDKTNRRVESKHRAYCQTLSSFSPPTLVNIADEARDTVGAPSVRGPGRESRTIAPRAERECGFTQHGARFVTVKEPPEESSDSTEASSAEEDIQWRHLHGMVPSEYYTVYKLVQFIKANDQSAVQIALGCLLDHKLTNDVALLGLRDADGFEVLVNLLETSDLHCQLGTLLIMQQVATDRRVRQALIDLGVIESLVFLLASACLEVRTYAAATMGALSENRKARRDIRKFGGLARLIELMSADPNLLATERKNLSDDDQLQVTCISRTTVARARREAVTTLWNLSRSKRNRHTMARRGIVPRLSNLVRTVHKEIIVPVIGVVKECVGEPRFQSTLQTAGMVEDLIKFLHDDNKELQINCTSAIFQGARHKYTRVLVRQLGGLESLVKLLESPDVQQDQGFLANVVGAIWKLSADDDNRMELSKMGVLNSITSLLLQAANMDELDTNLAGAVSELAHLPENRKRLLDAKVIPSLVAMTRGGPPLQLMNASAALGSLAHDPDCAQSIDKHEGVELVWSLLKHRDSDVKGTAALALCPILEQVHDPGEVVRSIVGAMDLCIAELRQARHPFVRGALCALVARICRDSENLTIVSDMGLVHMITKLIFSENLAEVVGEACDVARNREDFGKRGVIEPVCNWLSETRPHSVRSGAAFALSRLSRDGNNCVIIHAKQVVTQLVQCAGVGSEPGGDRRMQECAAETLTNIRRLALQLDRRMYGTAQLDWGFRTA